jgi:hypothetical protein
MARTPYPSDLTDAQWLIIEPLIPPAEPGGRPREVNFREVINAVFVRKFQIFFVCTLGGGCLRRE